MFRPAILLVSDFFFSDFLGRLSRSQNVYGSAAIVSSKRARAAWQAMASAASPRPSARSISLAALVERDRADIAGGALESVAQLLRAADVTACERWAMSSMPGRMSSRKDRSSAATGAFVTVA